MGLAMPRFLSRLPYGAKTNPVEAFNFEEETGGGDHSKYTWSNSAYAMAANINRSFKLYGWCTSIRGVESGGGSRAGPGTGAVGATGAPPTGAGVAPAAVPAGAATGW